MQDKMAAPKVTDTRTELAELIKKRAEIAVSFYQIVIFFIKVESKGLIWEYGHRFYYDFYENCCVYFDDVSQTGRQNQPLSWLIGGQTYPLVISC